MTILKILKILKISIHSRSDSRRWRGNILTYLIFIIIQLNLCSRDLDLPPGYIIWISRTWFLSRNFHLKIFDFYEIQEFFMNRGKNHVYSWIEISCWDGIFARKCRFLSFLNDFFNEFSAFCTWAMILLMNFVNFCILIRQKLSHQPKKISRNLIIVPKVKF